MVEGGRRLPGVSAGVPVRWLVSMAPLELIGNRPVSAHTHHTGQLPSVLLRLER